MTCPCKRIKKEFICEIVRKNGTQVSCDVTCQKKLEDERKIREMENDRKKNEEKLRDQMELAKYEKMFNGKKKHRDRRMQKDVEELSLFSKYRILILCFCVVIFSICSFLYIAA